MPDSSPEDVVDPQTQPEAPAESTAQTTTKSSDANPAAASTAEKPAETLLDRVRATLEKKPEASPASETPGDPAEADPTKTAKAEDSDHELPADEAKTLHPKTKERFGKLTSELKAAKTEVEQLQPKAAEYDKIDTFIRNAGLSPQDVGSTLQIAAMFGVRTRTPPASNFGRL